MVYRLQSCSRHDCERLIALLPTLRTSFAMKYGYNDNHVVAAPVGTYAPNALSIYDLSGNVAEWINDYYEIPSVEPVSDPLGPKTADYHVIRGSGWMNGTISDLRVSFRDYGSDGRQDVGFRIARFAESK